jgi:pantoate--beta-alanine ligase
LALLPSAESMFEKETKITLDFGALTHELEGKYRPGHFTGVGVVVAKLLNMTWPDKAYFGLKDLQQCAVIQMLVQDLGFPVSLRFVETVRESDGLAMSSRNQRLSASGRQKAALIYKTLNQIKQDLKNRLFSEVKIDGLKTLNAAGILEVEYLELVNFETMLPILKPELGNSSVICMAAWVDDVRLIDNIFV